MSSLPKASWALNHQHQQVHHVANTRPSSGIGRSTDTTELYQHQDFPHQVQQPIKPPPPSPSKPRVEKDHPKPSEKDALQPEPDLERSKQADGPGVTAPRQLKKSLSLHQSKAQPTSVHQSVYGILLDTKAAENLCAGLKLTTSHLLRLKRKFNAFDIYQSGEITREELFMLLHEEQRELTSGIFKYSPQLQPTQKYLKFDDFVLCTCSFAALTREELYRYVFDLFDVDKSGFLEQEEFHRLSAAMQSKRFCFPKNLQAALNVLERTANADDRTTCLIDFNDFVRINELCPLAFYPIIHMQNSVRQQTLGMRFWTRIADRKGRVDKVVQHLLKNLGRLPRETWLERFWSLFSNENAKIRIEALEKYHTMRGLRSQKTSKSLPIESQKQHRELHQELPSKSTTTDWPKHQLTRESSLNPSNAPQGSCRLTRTTRQDSSKNLGVNRAHAGEDGTHAIQPHFSKQPARTSQTLEIQSGSAERSFRANDTPTIRRGSSKRSIRADGTSTIPSANAIQVESTSSSQPSVSRRSLRADTTHSVQPNTSTPPSVQPVARASTEHRHPSKRHRKKDEDHVPPKHIKSLILGNANGATTAAAPPSAQTPTRNMATHLAPLERKYG